VVEAPGRVVFRVDGGATLASGHVMRCLTLASELTRRGAQVAFICRELPGHLGARVQREGYPLHLLKGPREGAPVPWQRDAEETRALLEPLHPEWLIVDHYELDAAWERVQRAVVARVLVIDDLADRSHACEVLLDQNYFGAVTGQRYAGLVPDETRLLLGPHYALLRREYAAARAALTPRTGAARRVLVFFGGSDATDETSKALQALSAPEFSHLAVDVVLGANHAAAAAVRALAAARPYTTLHTNLPSLAGLMGHADLAVGAGGTTTWERLCLELPSVVVTVAANQEQPSASLAAAGLVIPAGRAPAVSVEELRAAIASALRGPRHVRAIVDGYGAARVAAVMLPPSVRNLRLVPAGRRDAELLFFWRNDPLARAMSFDDGVIDWDTHLQWLDTKLADADVSIFIGVADGLPVGQARLDFTAGEAELSYSVDPLVRRLGFGMALAEQAVRSAGRVPAGGFRARVKAGNLASRRIFERLGWRATMAGADYVFRLAPGPGTLR
jgi:UDP-2,4-diacetamido-2,4,6-trideoxy-beta-L-altropyranose hydrolase